MLHEFLVLFTPFGGSYYYLCFNMGTASGRTKCGSRYCFHILFSQVLSPLNIPSPPISF